ncbi:MAG: methylated-DNA--[protein]-cysteine S-methyltransferase [Chloroflexota bacterium]|nr:methylated-DNA--[protein]-cysteine S-methyltransferase [Chloroflexota bacterium]MDE2959007.1 methylated-DNA--[protein]-cysteine S-methyltransferase [Chloroflexota bacterium]
MSSATEEHEMLHYCLQETPFGWLALLGNARGLLRVSLQPEPQPALDGLGNAMDDAEENAGVFEGTLAAFEEYFAGSVTALDRIPLDLSDASPFFGAAWVACRSIPPGETRSYQWLAEAAGNPRASRAAGQAMAKNPFPLIIPCHRVVGSSGGLHGYGAGGVGVKARLLEMERNRGTLL